LVFDIFIFQVDFTFPIYLGIFVMVVGYSVKIVYEQKTKVPEVEVSFAIPALENEDNTQ